VFTNTNIVIITILRLEVTALKLQQNKYINGLDTAVSDWPMTSLTSSQRPCSEALPCCRTRCSDRPDLAADHWHTHTHTHTHAHCHLKPTCWRVAGAE